MIEKEIYNISSHGDIEGYFALSTKITKALRDAGIEFSTIMVDSFLPSPFDWIFKKAKNETFRVIIEIDESLLKERKDGNGSEV